MNFITVLLIGIFVLPILSGMLSPFSGDIHHALYTWVKRLELLLVLLMSFSLARLAFSQPENSLWSGLYSAVPPLADSVAGQDIWLFLIAALLFLVVLGAVMRLLEHLLLRSVLIPFFHFVSSRYQAMTRAAKRLMGGAVQLPRSVALVLVFTLLFHFYIVYAKNTALGGYIGQSTAYQILDDGIVRPVLTSGLAGRAPVFVGDLLEKAVRNLSLSQLPAITYLNGTTLREAVVSNDELDELARALTAGITADREKAYLLYEWICGNINYDFEKVEVLYENVTMASSGSLDAYAAGAGVCFDYSCLYISMCRAAGVGVRFVSGKGRSDGVWEAHAWNQIYDGAEDSWISVDTTFGSAGSDYFGNADFFDDHTEGSILGEW